MPYSTGQLEKLGEILPVVLKTNLFQRERLRQSGEEEKLLEPREFLEHCPFTTKEELAKDHLENPPYGTNLTFPLEDYVRFHQTSGTKGAPMTWLDTREDWEWMLDNWNTVLDAAIVETKATCFFAFSFGPFLGFWTAFEAVHRRGCLSIPAGGMSSEQRLQAILNSNADYLFCTPTYALHLTEVAREKNWDLSKTNLRKIIVAGEPGGSSPELRKQLRKFWLGAEVSDHYGMTEVGPAAYENPDEEGNLRIIQKSFLAEVVSPESGEPVDEGEQGELVLTTLGRIGSPVFRYRTGDLVVPKWSKGEDGETCLDLIGGILGRTDDMVVVRGVNLYPSSVDSIIRKFDEVSEYQVEIDERETMSEARIRVEASSEMTVAIEKSLTEAFSLRIPVESVPKGSLPRFEMKAKRWIRVES